MKSILDIPLISQPPQSLECGLACSNMILNFDGKDIPYDTIKEKLPIREKFGLYIYEIGTYFMSLGYQAEIMGLNTHFMNVGHIGLSSDELKQQAISVRERRVDNERWKTLIPGFDTLIEFMDNGGTLAAKIITADDLRNELDKQRPVLAALTTHFLYPQDKTGHNQHFSVVTGYSDNDFMLNDPLIQNGKTHLIPADQMIYAIHANTAPSIEGGMILKLAPPSA